MNTSQIASILSGDPFVGPRFGGVCSADTLPDSFAKPRLFVVNTDTSDGKGVHWIAQYFPTEKPAILPV